MDALEYEKARIRMFRTMILEKVGCEAGPLYNILKRKCGFPASIIPNPDIDTIKNNVDRVIKWAKDHPVKTRQSEFLKLFPDAKTMGGVIVICPNHIDSTYRNVDTCDHSFCEECCKKYWSEEVTDND